MEGRAIARPNVYCSWVEPAVNVTLQWRAGQLPGQTRDRLGLVEHCGAPSMEGRAIARPNITAWSVVVAVLPPSMEGRAIARPNLRSESCWERSE